MGTKVFFGGITLLAASLIVPSVAGLNINIAGVLVTIVGYILIVLDK